MMGDQDTCLDAFKHLPYFKPLYTTILRQQMQYLTEQLSQHAGEESLVLTTNISAGTISSLTSTYGTGFLDVRADIKKQFTMHCAKNKLKHQTNFDKRSSHTDASYIQDQPNFAVKRGRLDIHHNSHNSIDVYSQRKDNDTNKNIHAVKADREICEVFTDPRVANTEIENVRGLQYIEKSVEEGYRDDIKTHEKEMAVGLPECNDSSSYIIKQEPDENESFMITEIVGESVSHESAVSDKGHDSTCYPEELDTNTLQEDEVDEGSFAQKERDASNAIVNDIVNELTDDVITVRKSYLSSSDESSLPDKFATVTDTDNMWIVAGEHSETNRVVMPEYKKHDQSLIERQQSMLYADADVDNSEPIINKNFPSSTTGAFSSNADIASDCKTGDLFMYNSVNLAKLRKPLDGSKAKFECQYCSQCFTTISSQRRHERRHTGVTPWACEFCDMKFYRKDDLHVHSLKHSGQKPYTCPICHMGYCKKKSLDVHVASHGE